MILVHKDAHWKSIKELIEAGKKIEKPLTISTSHPKAGGYVVKARKESGIFEPLCGLFLAIGVLR